jgi:MFS family permease
MSSYAADLAPADRRGEYMGFYAMAFGLAFAIGPWLGTEILDRLGAGFLWSAMFGLGIVSAASMWRLPARRTSDLAS